MKMESFKGYGTRIQSYLEKKMHPLYTLGFISALSPLLGIGGAQAYHFLHPFPTIEEMHRQYDREQAEIYEQSGGSNLEGKLTNQNIGIILVDMQDGFLRNIHPVEKVQLLERQKEVLTIAKNYDVPVLVFEMENEMQNFGRTTKALQDILDTIPRTKTFSKNRDDGFEIYDDHRRFDPEYFPSDWLEQQNVDTVYVMGVNGNACVSETADSARDLFSLTIATSNDVIATADTNAASGYCAFESCDEAMAGLVPFVEHGLIHQNNRPFLEYLQKKNKRGSP